MPHIPLLIDPEPEVNVFSRPQELKLGQSPFGPLAEKGAGVTCDNTCAVKGCEERCSLALYHDHGSPEAHLCLPHDTLRKAKEMAKAPKSKASSSTVTTPPPRELTVTEHKRVFKKPLTQLLKRR